MSRLGPRARDPRRRLALASLLAGVTACLPPPSSRPAPAASGAAPEASARRLDLLAPSGLRVIYEERPGSHVATVTMVVEAGQRYDPEGRAGMAGLVAELSTRALATREIRLGLDISAMGVQARSEAGLETVMFVASSPARALMSLFDAQLARLAAPLEAVDEDTFEVARAALQNELQRRSQPTFSGPEWDRLSREVFPPPHPYGRFGTPESLAAVRLDDARAWAEHHYRPERATVVVTSPRPVAEVQGLVSALLPPALAGDPRRPVVVSPRWTEGTLPAESTGPHALVRERADVVGPELLVGWSAPPAHDPGLLPLRSWAAFMATHRSAADLHDEDVTRLTCPVRAAARQRGHVSAQPFAREPP
jgi:hypothetical protein